MRLLSSARRSRCRPRCAGRRSTPAPAGSWTSDGIRRHALNNNYGDWLCIPSDCAFRAHSEMKTLLATAYWADDAAKMARMARELERPDEAARFADMHDRVRQAFQEEWLRDDGRLAVETQTAYLLALAFDLVPGKLRERAAAHLVADIESRGGHLSTGFIGIGHLNPVLTLLGHADVAYRLLLNEDYPSWLYPGFTAPRPSGSAGTAGPRRRASSTRR